MAESSAATKGEDFLFHDIRDKCINWIKTDFGAPAPVAISSFGGGEDRPNYYSLLRFGVMQ